MVVTPDGGGGLGVAKGGESGTELAATLQGSEDGRVLRFSGGSDNDGNAGTEHEEGAVGAVVGVGGGGVDEGDRSKEVSASGNAAGVGAGEVGGINGYGEEHVGGADAAGGGGAESGVAEEAEGGSNGGLGGGGLLCGDVSEGGEEGGVKGTSVVEERANGSLDVQFFSGGCGGGVRDGCHLWFGGTIGRGNVNGRGFEFANALGASLVEEAWNV